MKNNSFDLKSWIEELIEEYNKRNIYPEIISKAQELVLGNSCVNQGVNFGVNNEEQPIRANQNTGYWQSILNPMVATQQMPKLEMETDAMRRNKPSMLPDFGIKNSNNNLKKVNNIMDFGKITPLLEGAVQKNVNTNNSSISKLDELLSSWSSLRDKYKGLSPLEKLQKSASKAPIDTVEREYYGLSTKLKDKEMMEDKTMEENNIYNLSDIKDPKLSKYYQDYLAKMYNLNPNDPATYEKIKDKQIVIPKDTSRLYNYAKNSKELQKWVAENYERIKNGEKPVKDYVEFSLGLEIFDNQKRGLNTTLHNMDIRDARVSEDGSFNLNGMDPYDFRHNKYFQNIHDIQSFVREFFKAPYTLVNNVAHGQQKAKQIENFLFSIPIKYSQEELEEIRRKLMQRRNAI